MDLAEAGALLTYAASCDARIGTPGKQDAIRWADLLEGMTFARCKAAIRKHYQESDEKIMPSHIRRLARTMTDLDDGPVEIEPLVSRSGRQLEPRAGEVLCPDCALIHRPDESCEEFAATRERFADRRRALGHVGSVVKALTDAPAEGLSGRPSAVHERALQRARAEKGNIAWDAAAQRGMVSHVEPREGLAYGDPIPPADDGGAPREERDPDVSTLSPTVEGMAELRGATPRRCGVCQATFLDVAEGRTSHRVVFGHDPRGDVPARAEGVS